jgi:benzaldehyde dehydrogenase (NAD)
MDAQLWDEKTFNGEWTAAGAGEYPVVEPATGAELGMVGKASVDNVRRAARQAAEAQEEWGRVPYNDERMVAIAKLAYRRGAYGYAFFQD